MPKEQPWRIKAHLILESHRSGADCSPLTQSSLAKELGVARQTLWRDEEIKAKILSLKQHGTAKRKRSKDLRIAELEKTIRSLKQENGLLIQNLILACKRLRDRGLNPSDYISEIAENIEIAFPGLPAHVMYEFLQPAPPS